MASGTFAEFQAQALAEGFDEVLERSWPADAVLDAHTHPFAVKARVVRGEMWLTVGDDTRHLKVGDSFELARDVAHAERYGNIGATYWVARRN
ncbi:MAG: AraC family transcriptional regulator [Betaproteobacteria bacterium HGW-Betaproteobacteria-6]|jgi:quercetin dioxygenase-like cupin family protein|nr:MAG: AraC family transcriptional regulator [Betaproteobacteria bacterium HGW-Betaproteobacteria-6]